MFCLSCGKKISKISKFCKYCGSSQITKKIKKKGYETVWICDFCGKEFPSQKISDKHEFMCADNPKNKKLPYNTNPKKGWTIFWLTTIIVFILTCFISAKFVDKGIFIMNRNILSAMFFGNICLGVIAFFGMALSEKKPKNNKLNEVIKYSLIICLIYLIINPSVFALEGFRANQNEEYKNKYYIQKQPILPTPTPLPSDYQNSLMDKVNVYRSNKKLTNLILDNEVCKLAEKIINKPDLKSEITEDDYNDTCPRCTKISYSWVENTSIENIVASFEKSEETKKNMEGNFKYGCGVIKNNLTLFLFANKSSNQTKKTTNNTNNNQVECIGPDGKNFWTSMDECKKLNEKWGKSLDYMTNCEIHPDCGSGTIRMSYSQCMKPCSGLTIKSNNQQNNTIVTSTQNNTPKVAFQATETTIKGTYYCYDNKVNEMVTQQSYVKLIRENYELCSQSQNKKDCFGSCLDGTCEGKSGSDFSNCSQTCYDTCFAECIETYKKYSSERSKLDTMRWNNCP